MSDTDDFFKLGGNSLNGLQLTWKMQAELSASVQVNALFDHPVFSDFAAFVEQELSRAADTSSAAVNEPIVATRKMDATPLSYPQEHMFLLDKLVENPSDYNIVFQLEFGSTLNTKAAAWALHAMVGRQASLRTVFRSADDRVGVYQEVVPVTECFLQLNWVDTSAEEHERLVDAEKKHRFDFIRPLLRIITLRHSDSGRYLVLVSHHHIITDGWSMTVFAQEFSDHKHNTWM